MSQEELNAIKQDILDHLICPLKDAATNMVFGKGNPDADILFIGEAPGQKEDEQGIPFVGRAGQELDKQLHLIGLSLDEVYIANILKYRPPQNRDPTSEEIRNHTPYLIRQIQVIKPKVIITLGNYATKFVLAGFNPDGMAKITGVSALHGKRITLDIEGVTYQVMPMFHPAAMMYNPKLRESFEKDFQMVASLLGLKGAKEKMTTLADF
ncbi:MAG: uracil-DNA glycosylase [Nanoarchaeota archaeon]|nr:uracil-DNA glycosylase [Nanoarchaeota archaeon]